MFKIKLMGILQKILLVAAILSLMGCGTLTGIPSHGGGKRFAVEQKLLAGTIRACIKDFDLSKLVGKRVTFYVVGMGDGGSGNINGGRFGLSSIYSRKRVNSPESHFSEIKEITTGDVNTVAKRILNYPFKTRGEGYEATFNTGFQGLGAYHNEAILNPKDADFLSAIIQQYMLLKGVKIVRAQEADIEVYIMVDVFGTIRSRKDWYISNEESLIAETSLELMAIDRLGNIVIPPTLSSFKAEYKEKYKFWAGPTSVTMTISRSEGLLVDFTDVRYTNK